MFENKDYVFFKNSGWRAVDAVAGSSIGIQNPLILNSWKKIDSVAKSESRKMTKQNLMIKSKYIYTIEFSISKERN